MRTLLLKLTAVMVIGLSTISPSHALDDLEKEEIGKFIREYLIKNPEVLAEAQATLEVRVAEQEKVRTREMITGMSDRLYNAEGDVIIGNPEADVTIVEFFDYNCGFCKRAMNDMQEIVSADPNVKFILKEFPILGEESLEASRVSMAVAKIAPEKGADFHIALLGGGGRAGKAQAMKVAEDMGVDMDALNVALEDDALLDPISVTYNLAQELGINGTPSYVIGNEAVYGAVGVSDILSKVDNIRKCGETICS
jgi:protein-disulfide isomerase